MKDLELRTTMYDLRGERNKVMKEQYQVARTKDEMRVVKDIVIWLKENNNNYTTRKELLNALNKHFNISISIAYLNQLN